MTSWLVDTFKIVVAGIIINMVLLAWDNVSAYTPAPSQPFTLPMPTITPKPAPTPTPTPTHIPTPAPAPPQGTQVIYVFNMAPMRVWFDKADALGYREAVLDGAPTRPYVDATKSRTVRGGRMFVLKQEDGLIMVKAEGEDLVGWIQ